MTDQQFQMGRLIISVLLLMLSSCTGKSSRSTVYVSIYANSDKRVILTFDGKVIFDRKTPTSQKVEVVRGPIIIDKKDIEIHYLVDEKDTTIMYRLKPKNYINILYSDSRNEFQFGTTDSVSFFNSRID